MKKEDLEALLVWIKRRELGWRKRAGKESEMTGVMRFIGRAEAYEDVWRQILFPGKSVEDGTLSPAEYNAAVAEWTRKAEEGGGTDEERDVDL